MSVEAVEPAAHKPRYSVSRKGMGGRPAIYDADKAHEILQLLAMGEPLAKICKRSGFPSYMTVRDWEVQNSQFADFSARAKREGTHHLADDCLIIADDPDLEPHDKRIRIDTRMRLMGMWNRIYYGESKHVQVSGAVAVEHSGVDMRQLSPEQRAAIEQVLQLVASENAQVIEGSASEVVEAFDDLA